MQHIDFMLREPASRPHLDRGRATTRSCRARREGLGRYERFVREGGDGHVLLLELGVGEMTPGIIMLPFWSMAAKLPDAHLLSVNISGSSAPLQLGSKAEAIQADLGLLLSAARAGGK